VITKSDASAILNNYLDNEYPHHHGASKVVINDDVIECRDGWIFTYTTMAFHRTKDPRHAMIGAGPVLVLRESGKFVEFTSAFSKERAQAEYEANPNMFRVRE
jgi:hypothetical protein